MSCKNCGKKDEPNMSKNRRKLQHQPDSQNTVSSVKEFATKTTTNATITPDAVSSSVQEQKAQEMPKMAKFNYGQERKAEKVKDIPAPVPAPVPARTRETRVLHIGINLPGQRALSEALASIGPYVGFDWREWWSKTGKNTPGTLDRLTYIIRQHKPNFIFLQVQTEKVFKPVDIQRIIDACPKGVQVLNWSGDVKPETIPWYIEVSKILNVCTAFSDSQSVTSVKNTGECAHLLPIGYEESVYNTAVEPIANGPEIVFTGTLYPRFPLMKDRMRMIEALYAKYGKRVAVYGGGWSSHAKHLAAVLNSPISPEQTARVYRGAKVIIGLNNYNIPNYTSDRMFNACASGTLYLPMGFVGIEKLYTNNRHILVWNTVEELLARVDSVISSQSKRDQMGREAAAYTVKNHRWINRINTICEWMEL
jgi:hypothetical protein